ncbi:MAG: transposase [Methanoregula sp.]
MPRQIMWWRAPGESMRACRGMGKLCHIIQKNRNAYFHGRPQSFNFGEKWDATHPRVSQSWQNNWQRIIPYFAYPPEIRRVIYTTNTIESLNMSLRKVTKNRGSFPNDEAMFKLLYLALTNISKRWTMPIKNWKSALNQFSIMFEDRLPEF